MTGFEQLKKKIAGMNLDELAEFYECLNGCPSNIELKNDCTQSCIGCWKKLYQKNTKNKKRGMTGGNILS